MIPGEQIWSELKPRFGSSEPVVVFQAELGPDEGGPPLSRIVAFKAVEPQPHWHFVTCGLSASRFIKGYPEAGGVELTFRLGRAAGDKKPPKWVAEFLQQLGRTAFYDERIEIAEKVELAARWQQPDTALTAGYYVKDPLVPAGSIPLVQLVALTSAERGRVEVMTGEARRLKLLLELAPAGISDLSRARPAPRPARASSTPTPSPRFKSLTVAKSGSRMRLAIGASEVQALVEAIAASVRVGKVSCSSQGWTVHLNVEDIPRSASWGTTLAVYFTLELAKQVSADLVARPGKVLRFDGLPDLELVVSDGKTR